MPVAGSETSPALPGNVTVAVKWLTATRGRSARGRTFHVGLCESQVSGNDVGGAVLVNLAAAYGALLTRVNVNFATLRILSYQTNGAPRTTAQATTVNALAIGSKIDTQRRRLN
jgi:hypothetical protein